MSAPSFLILYVKDLPRSVEFYKSLLGLAPVDQSPGFALFVLPNGLKFGLWLTGTVEPEVEAAGGGAEYCFDLSGEAELTASFEAARSAGLSIAQSPTLMSFGLTYVLEDPDHHRIRYYVPAAA
jgi:catechol 2,3-dioxygenase-like lactoylglutathione lyase family enzyme